MDLEKECDCVCYSFRCDPVKIFLKESTRTCSDLEVLTQSTSYSITGKVAHPLRI